MEAQRILDKLMEQSTHRYVPAFLTALIWMGLGEKDCAFEWLEAAYREREFTITLIGIAPEIDPLRSDPRFDDLLRRINYPGAS